MESSYRLRARAVRAEAQQHLRQMRAERLTARRRPAVAAPDGPPADPVGESAQAAIQAAIQAAGPALSAATPPLTVSRAAAALSETAAPDPGPDPAPEAPDPGPDMAGEPAQPTLAAAADAPPDLPDSTAAEADITPAAEGPDGEAVALAVEDLAAGEPPAAAAADAPAAEAADAPAAAAAPDLAPSGHDDVLQPVIPAAPPAEGRPIGSIRSFGPGLVWLLETAGVTTVEALMSGDTEDLSQRLGLVGRLVNIERLRAMAAEDKDPGQ